MRYYILHNPNNELPEDRKFVYYPMVRECVQINKRQLFYLINRISVTARNRVRAYLLPEIYPLYGFHYYPSDMNDIVRFTIMLLNPRRDIFRTFVHEMLHFLYNPSTEGEILAMERQMEIMMTSRHWSIINDTMKYCLNHAPKRSKQYLIGLLGEKNLKWLVGSQRREIQKGRIDREHIKELNSGSIR